MEHLNMQVLVPCSLAILMVMCMYAIMGPDRPFDRQTQAKKAIKLVRDTNINGQASFALLVAAILRVQYGNDYPHDEKTVEMVIDLLWAEVKRDKDAPNIFTFHEDTENPLWIEPYNPPWTEPYTAFLTVFDGGYEKNRKSAAAHAALFAYDNQDLVQALWTELMREFGQSLAGRPILKKANLWPVATRCYNGHDIVALYR